MGTSLELETDVVVVGGGLAGLAAAAFAAREGARVTLLERASDPGGRAATHEDRGYRFNVGPHALYAGGRAASVLAELGVAWSGRRPPASGGLALRGGRLHALPGGLLSMLTTGLLSVHGKLEVARLLASIGGIDPTLLRGQTLRQWLDGAVGDPVARELVEALMRLTAYANAPERSCAAASVAQLQEGVQRGVCYVDGGWRTLVDGLVTAVENGPPSRSGPGAGVMRSDAPATVCAGYRVLSVTPGEHGFEVAVRASRARDGEALVGETADGVPAGADADERCGADARPAPVQRIRARAVVLAVPPAVAASLVGGEDGVALRALADAAEPVRAACLDLGLERLPDPRRLFALGIDQPLYFSVHSASARLAPDGGALVHVAKYLPPGASDPRAVLAELEAFCDVVQPGWRGVVASRRYLPSMVVVHDLVAAGRCRPGTEASGVPGLLVAGDWVGAGGAMLADAALATGREAGLAAAARAREERGHGGPRSRAA